MKLAGVPRCLHPCPGVRSAQETGVLHQEATRMPGTGFGQAEGNLVAYELSIPEFPFAPDSDMAHPTFVTHPI